MLLNIGTTFYFDWEPSFMAFLQGHMGSLLTALAGFFTLFGEETIMILIMAFSYFVYDKVLGRFLGVRMIFADVLNSELKNIFCRRRPYFDNDNVKCLKAVEADADIYDIAAQGFSFPSGHSNNASTVYIGIATFFKKKFVTVIMVLLTLLVGVSRFCLGVHYPTDVFAGWGLGLIVLAFMALIEKKIKDVRIQYLILFIIGLPGLFYCKTNDFYTSYGMLLGFFLGDLFERKFVNFENLTELFKKDVPGKDRFILILRAILRVLGTVACYLGLNALLKLPFPKEFLAEKSMASFLVRFARYTVVIFVTIGVYPMLFKYTGKIWNKQS